MSVVHNEADEYSEEAVTSNPRMVAQVDHVHLTLSPGDPEHCYVLAVGQTNSVGWTRPRLQARIYITPPEDGIYELDFIANPPAGPTFGMMTAIMADTHIRRPQKLRGVRVYGGKNAVVASLSIEDRAGVVCVRGELITTDSQPGVILKTSDGEAYALTGNMQQFGPDDQVIVCGTPMSCSTDGYLRALRVHWIGQDTASPAAVPGRIITPV